MYIKIVFVLVLCLCLAYSACAQTSAKASATVNCFIDTHVEMNVQKPLFIESSTSVISKIPVRLNSNTGSIILFVDNQESVMSVEDKCSNINLHWGGNQEVRRVELAALLLP